MFATCCLVFAAAAEWIAGSYVPPQEGKWEEFFKEAPNDVVARSFKAHKSAVAKATWRVVAPGFRDLSVNGRRASATPLPPWTPYRHRIYEETFDVTPLVRGDGADNTLQVELGNGWWNIHPLPMWYVYQMRQDIAQGIPCVKATLEISYADGSKQEIVTDGLWRAAKGKILKNSIYLGVLEDARRSVCFTEPASIVKGPTGRIVPAGDFPKVTVIGRHQAVGVTRLADGTCIVDFGANRTGNIRATMRGVPSGTKVSFRSGERLHPDGTLNQLTAVAGQIKKPERGPFFAIAEQRDSWISDGAAMSVFEPRLTFHVFRYVHVTGLPYLPKPSDFEMVSWSADLRDGASFVCSNEKVNRLHEMCRRTFQCNLQSVQSDCPGREKFGYGGDMACTAESFCCNWGMHAFYVKALRDFLDEAKVDGYFTETAPYVGIGSNPVVPRDQNNGRSPAPMGWAVGVPIIADLLVRYYGDVEILREAYPAFVRYVDILTKRYPNDDIPKCLGDWIAIDKADQTLSCHANWHEFLALTAKFARILGKTDDAAKFEAHAARVAAKFRNDWVKKDGLVNTGIQGEQLYALYHGLLDQKDVAPAYSLLKADIVKHGNALTTGIFATQYLFEYLSLHGDAELAGKVAFHEGFPGYFEMMDRGATTLWEDWKEQTCLNGHSNCHPMFGSVEQWFLRHVVGICVAGDAIGCDKVKIAPHAVGDLTWARGHLDTPKGRISVSWKLVDGKLSVEKSIPEGITVVRD